MKETSFIEQNKEKWKRFQDLASAREGNPEEIADLYSDITDDLSYAQTFYNRRTVRVYLNQIAQGIHNLVHKERSESLRKFITVWKVSLPLEIYRSRKHLLFALCVFVGWAILGAVSTHFNPDFPRMILGDGYVEQTLENIKHGNPLKVYEDENQVAMFLNISINNIKVSFLCFIFGFFFTIGTHIIIFQNGVMLGAFQYFFHLKGVLLVSFLGIWIHGAFEISCVVIAGGAGITMGNGWLFPGSYTRLQSLQLSARRGLKIMMSLVPFLLVAGFLESYVTHNYDYLPEWSKWLFILFCFAIIIGYFLIYPIIVARKYPELVHEKHVTNHTYKNTFNLSRLRTFGQMFADSFSFYRVHIGKIFKINLVFSFPIIIITAVLQDMEKYDLLKTQHWYDWSEQLKIIMGMHLSNLQDVLVLGAWTVIFSTLCLSVFYCFKFQEEKLVWSQWMRFFAKNIAGVWLCNIMLFLVLFMLPWYWLFLMVFIIPFFWLNSAVFALSPGKAGRRLSSGFSYSARAYGNTILSICVLSLILFLFAQPIAFVGSIHRSEYAVDPPMPDLLDMVAGFLKDASQRFMTDFVVPSNILRQVVYVLFMFLVLPLFVIMSGFIYSDIYEKNTAAGLHEQFALFGKRKRNQETIADYE